MRKPEAAPLERGAQQAAERTDSALPLDRCGIPLIGFPMCQLPMYAQRYHSGFGRSVKDLEGMK